MAADKAENLACNEMWDTRLFSHARKVSFGSKVEDLPFSEPPTLLPARGLETQGPHRADHPGDGAGSPLCIRSDNIHACSGVGSSSFMRECGRLSGMSGSPISRIPSVS